MVKLLYAQETVKAYLHALSILRLSCCDLSTQMTVQNTEFSLSFTSDTQPL